MCRWVILAVALWVFTGCEPTATPLPVGIIADTATPDASATPKLRYVLTQRIAPFLGLGQGFGDTVDVLIVPDIDTLMDADIVIDFGEHTGMIRTPQAFTVRLLLNTNIPPLDDPVVGQIIQIALASVEFEGSTSLPGAIFQNQQGMITGQNTRSDLANAGFPDGVNLTLRADYVPDVARFAEIAQTHGIHLRIEERTGNMLPLATPEPASIHLWLTSLSPEMMEIPPSALMVDFYSLPISYRASPEIQLRFTAQGFPVPATP